MHILNYFSLYTFMPILSFLRVHRWVWTRQNALFEQQRIICHLFRLLALPGIIWLLQPTWKCQ